MGELSNVEDSKSKLYGFYAQESIDLSDRLLLDVGARVERLSLSMDGDEYHRYNYSTGRYAPGRGAYSVSQDYNIFSPKIGLSYDITDSVTLYGSIAKGEQAPTTNEISANMRVGNSPDLDVASSTNYEVGLKARTGNLFLDTTLYYTKTKDEIVSRTIDRQSIFTNAGETTKKGVEISAVYKINDEFSIDANYAYSDYEYDDYVDGTVNYAGNKFKFIPKHSYSIGATYENSAGFMARVEARSWGSYYMDDANTEKYGGYDFVTNMMAGYKTGNHKVQLNISNLFDKRYASSVEKTSGWGGDRYTYKVAEPRTAMLTYQYQF